jgi:AcrR family transcriptional regulator
MTTDNDARLSGEEKLTQGARKRLVAAFNAMLLGRESERRRAGAVASRAGVSRTTFYDHFQNTDDLELAAMNRPLEALADLAAGHDDNDQTSWWLTHFWDYRSDVRKLLSGQSRARIDRQLEALIRARVPDDIDATFFATQASAAIMSSIDAWVHSRIIAKPPELALKIGASCDALRKASGYTPRPGRGIAKL